VRSAGRRGLVERSFDRPVRFSPRGNAVLNMSQSRTQRRPASISEDAARRIGILRRIYEQGYIDRATFEAMQRGIEARVERPPA
jgi:hypothetical protein